MRFLTCLVALLLMGGSLFANPFPDPDLPSDEVIAATPGITIYQTKNRAFDDGKFGVFIPSSYKPDQPMRLVVSSHGNGGSGETEVRDWKGLAEKFGFIVACPSYLAPSQGPNDQVVQTDNETLKEIMQRVFASLNIDRTKVLHTGFSGGSLSTWYVAAQHDEWFTALCLRSGNWRGDPNIRLSRWRHRPIYILWGANDLPNIPGESQSMLDFAQNTMHNTSVKHEVLPGGHHESRPDLVAKWFAGLTDNDFEAPDPDAPVHL